MIHSIRTDCIQNTVQYKEWGKPRITMDLHVNYELLTPNAQVRLLSNATVSKETTERFLEIGAKPNILRTTAKSLICVSSGIHSYASFCVLLGRPFIPTTESTVLMRSATFSNEGTFRNYLPRLRKACYMKNTPVAWLTPAARSATKGTKAAEQWSFKFPNALLDKDILGIINSLLRGREHSLLSFMCFLFSQSAIGSFDGQKSLQGRQKRGFGHPSRKKYWYGRERWKGDALIVKFSRRRNLAGGFVLKMMCLRGEQ